jgi:hypothetical protein
VVLTVKFSAEHPVSATSAALGGAWPSLSKRKGQHDVSRFAYL